MILPSIQLAYHAAPAMHPLSTRRLFLHNSKVQACVVGKSLLVQVLTWVLSYDGEQSPEPLAITAASAALCVSGMSCAQSALSQFTCTHAVHMPVTPTSPLLDLSPGHA